MCRVLSYEHRWIDLDAVRAVMLSDKGLSWEVRVSLSGDNPYELVQETETFEQAQDWVEWTWKTV